MSRMKDLLAWITMIATVGLMIACTAAITPPATSSPAPTATEMVRQHFHDQIEGLAEPVPAPH